MNAVSDWRPTASLETLRMRARMLARIRAFFAARGVLEVETPLLSQAATTDTHLESLAVPLARERRYLHTSPEFPMKRLLAAGSGDIYQIAKVFRADEGGRLHNPEFSMLEWYRLGFDHVALMDEVEALLEDALAGSIELAPTERLSYAQAFERHAGLEPHHADAAACEAAARRLGVAVEGTLHRDDWLDLLMGVVVGPALPRDRFTIVYDYPASQAALARLRRREDGVEVAARFEVFWGEVELANGFHELTDAAEQRRRFEADLARRAGAGQPLVPVDERLLAALEAGLPDCAGVALGFDRLVMLAAQATDIGAVLAFPWSRA